MEQLFRNGNSGYQLNISAYGFQQEEAVATNKGHQQKYTTLIFDFFCVTSTTTPLSIGPPDTIWLFSKPDILEMQESACTGL